MYLTSIFQIPVLLYFLTWHISTDHESRSTEGRLLQSALLISMSIHRVTDKSHQTGIQLLIFATPPRCDEKCIYLLKLGSYKIFGTFYPLPYGMLWSFLQLFSTAKSTDVFFLETHWVVCSRI